MRRGPTALAPSPLPTPSPLAGEGGGEGKKGPLSPLWPIPPRRHARAARANEKRDSSLRKSEILHFVQNDNGEGQNEYGERMTMGKE